MTGYQQEGEMLRMLCASVVWQPAESSFSLGAHVPVSLLLVLV